jgi:hypothetical protein
MKRPKAISRQTTLWQLSSSGAEPTIQERPAELPQQQSKEIENTLADLLLSVASFVQEC